MKKTAVMSCILLLFICSLLRVDGMVNMKNANGKRLYRQRNFEDISAGIDPMNNGQNMLQRDQEFRRSICLSARELDCERELQDQ
ncbi:hypothetical protein ACROYT_G000227 [Oculina patagonica]